MRLVAAGVKDDGHRPLDELGQNLQHHLRIVGVDRDDINLPEIRKTPSHRLIVESLGVNRDHGSMTGSVDHSAGCWKVAVDRKVDDLNPQS